MLRGPLNALNPAIWWQMLITQLGFININVMRSKNIDKEKEITEKDFGYGQQLGRVVEAVSVLVAHVRSTSFGLSEKWPKRQRHMLYELSEMAEKIAKRKGERLVPTEYDEDPTAIARRSLSGFLDAMEHLKREDPTYYNEHIHDRLWKLLSTAEEHAQVDEISIAAIFNSEDRGS